MDFLDVLGWILIVVVLIVGVWSLSIIIPTAYHEAKSYWAMQDECEANPDICFCASGSCSMKSSCSYTRINDGPQTGGCNYTKICEIVTKANWKEGIWEYDCEIK